MPVLFAATAAEMPMVPLYVLVLRMSSAGVRMQGTVLGSPFSTDRSLLFVGAEHPLAVYAPVCVHVRVLVCHVCVVYMHARLCVRSCRSVYVLFCDCRVSGLCVCGRGCGRLESLGWTCMPLYSACAPAGMASSNQTWQQQCAARGISRQRCVVGARILDTSAMCAL